MIVAILLSSFTLWLLEHPIKYFFFVFQIVLTVTLTWTFVLPKFRVALKLAHTKQSVGSFAHVHVRRSDVFFIFASATLLFVNVFNVSTPANILLAFIVVSLLPGYVLLRLINVFDVVPYLEAVFLSYVLSLALSGMLPTLFMPIATQNNRVAFLGLLTFLSTLPFLKDAVARYAVPKRKTRLEFNLANLALLGIVVGFFLVIMIYLYPQMSFVPGHDIVRNFSAARLWSLSPELFSSAYPFFHIYQSTIYVVSTPSIELYQTFLALTSVSVLLSFYLMARKYLHKIDNRLPGVATVFWAIFSGLGWVYLFENKLGHPNTPQRELLRTAYDATYADIGYGLSTNLWLYGFIAMTASFTIFFTLLYLLKCKKLPKTPLMLLTSVLVLAIYFMHPPELVMFTILLAVLAFLGQRNDLRLDEMLSSTFVGLVGILLASLFMTRDLPGLPILSYIPTALIFLVGLVYLLKRFRWKGVSAEKRSHFIKFFTYALAIFFIAGLLGWFPLKASFSMTYVGHTFLVPWFFHPLRLGIVGLLGLLGMIVIAKGYSENAVAAFPLIFITAWIMGRVISFVNVSLLYTGYSEWRFLFFSSAATSVISALFLKHIGTQKIILNKSSRRVFLNSFLIGLLVLSGVSSTFLTIEKRILSTDEKFLLDENELDAISFLSSTFVNQTPAPLLTVTYQSANSLEFVPSPWVEKQIQPVIWLPEYPEIPFTFMHNQKFSPPYIYLHQRDLDAVFTMDLQNGYVARHLLQNITKVYDTSDIKIYRLPNGVPPLPNGKSALVTPSNKSLSESSFLASHILSLGGYNYTSMLSSDSKISEKDILIFPADCITANETTKLGLKKIVILNLDGHGPLSKLFFDDQSENGETTATHLATPDVETPLPLEIRLTPLAAREEVQVLAWYANGVERTPIVAMRIFDDQTQVFYLNVHPLVRAASSSENATQSLLQILASLLDIVELPKYNETSTSWVIEDDIPVFAFKEGLLNGNVSIHTESIIPSEKLNLSETYIVIDNTQTLLNDVAALSLHNIAGKITLFSQNVSISNGTGFYAFIKAENPEITMTGDSILISASTLNGTNLNFEGVGTAKLAVNGSFSAYLRTPCIYNIGNSSFREVYAFHSYLGQLRTMGEGLLVKGEVKFGLPLSDQYNVASDFIWDGVAARDPPVLTWDELKSLVDALPYFALAIGIFCTTYVATQKIRIRVGRRK